MKIFLDTANIEEIKKAVDSGVLDGVTTNPSKISETGQSFEKVAREIMEIVPGDVSIEAVSDHWEDMIDEVKMLSSWGKNAVIKLPMTRDGIKALSIVSKEGYKINLTMVCSLNQALLACKGGAKYVSFFTGRIDAIGIDGMDIIRDTSEMIQKYNFKSEIIVGSIRTPLHVLKAATQAGAHVVTMSYKVFDQLFDHPLTDTGLAKFKEDWEKVPK